VDGTDNGLAWPVFTTVEDSSLLHIDSAQPSVIKNPYEDKFKFWSGLPLTSRLNISIPSISTTKSYVKSEF
jgi:carboxylesterase 2